MYNREAAKLLRQARELLVSIDDEDEYVLYEHIKETLEDFILELESGKELENA